MLGGRTAGLKRARQSQGTSKARKLDGKEQEGCEPFGLQLDVLSLLLSYLQRPEDLASAECTCRAWRKAASERGLWDLSRWEEVEEEDSLELEGMEHLIRARPGLHAFRRGRTSNVMADKTKLARWCLRLERKKLAIQESRAYLQRRRVLELEETLASHRQSRERHKSEERRKLAMLDRAPLPAAEQEGLEVVRARILVMNKVIEDVQRQLSHAAIAKENWTILIRTCRARCKSLQRFLSSPL